MSAANVTSIINSIKDLEKLADTTAKLAVTRAMAGKSTLISRTRKAMRETITYPQIKEITARSDSCLNPTMASEHILVCGHIINTDAPDEPCAPNYYHIFVNREISIDTKGFDPFEALRAGKDSYCDACIKTEFESKMPLNISSEETEKRRAVFKKAEAKARSKDTKYRKCYIAYKCAAVSCHSDGSIPLRYLPSKSHPFDTAMPRIGSNMFEDVDPREVDKDGVTGCSAAVGS